MPAVDLVVPGAIETLTGGYIYDRRILAGLAALGWATRVIALDPSFPEPTDPALADAKARLDRLPDGRLVVIDGLALTGLGPLLDDLVRRARVVALIHHPLADETGLAPAVRERLGAGERSALTRVERVVVTSPWTRDRLIAGLGVDPDRIGVVVPGVERFDLPPRRQAGRTLKLLTVGTVTPRKGHAVLIEALGLIRRRDWTLRCAGSLDRDPATVAKVRAGIERHGLGDRTELLGELGPAAVAAEYAAADLFVLPSYLEGYGMAVAEAVVAGLPVVAAAAGAVPSTLPPGAGVLVKPGDPAALADAIAALCDDRDRLREIAAAARTERDGIPTWAQAAARFAAELEPVAT